MTNDELLAEIEQLKIKLNYFKTVAKRNHDKAQIGEQTLKSICFAPSGLAHKIANEGLEEMKK